MGQSHRAPLEQKLAELEGAEAAVAFASGMAAATGLFLHLLKAGDHLVISDVSYAGIAEVVRQNLTRYGVQVTAADLSDINDLKQALKPNTKLVWAETPANPILRLTDIRAVADITHKAGAQLAVDSTFATPIATRPIELGADFVVPSLTKYICGHGDAVGGAVIGPRNILAKLRQDTAIHLGGVISPFNAWLISRGLATLPLRMAAHADGALRVAKFLQSHPKVRRVIYPGLPSHPQYDLACRQMANFSGMMTFQTQDPMKVAQQLAERLEVIHYAVSLGHHRSLVFYLSTDDVQQNSFQLDDEHLRRYRQWAGEGVFRFSVGLEDPDDLCADLEQAMADTKRTVNVPRAAVKSKLAV